MAGWIDTDKRGQAVNRESCGDAVAFRVNYGNCTGLTVDDVDLITNRVGGEMSRIGADLQGAVLAEIDEVEHGDGVGAAVADVGVLPIADRNVGEAAPVAARDAKESCADNSRDGSREEGSEG
jgi:hypothetical protein